MGDDGFGPVERGGGDEDRPDGRSASGAAPVQAPPGRTPAESDDEGFGPVLGGGPGAGRAPAPDRGLVSGPSAAPPSDGYGPAARGRRSLRGRFRPAGSRLPRVGVGGVLRGVTVVLLVVALIGLVAGGALLTTTTSAMRRVDVDGLGRAGSRMNVLVVGSDSRDEIGRAHV